MSGSSRPVLPSESDAWGLGRVPNSILERFNAYRIFVFRLDSIFGLFSYLPPLPLRLVFVIKCMYLRSRDFSDSSHDRVPTCIPRPLPISGLDVCKSMTCPFDDHNLVKTGFTIGASWNTAYRGRMTSRRL